MIVNEFINLMVLTWYNDIKEISENKNRKK